MKNFLVKKWYIVLLLSFFIYHSWLMQMFPWEKQKLNCKLDYNNIYIYKVPKEIKLEIYGWGAGKFINDQYFGNETFNLYTKGNKYSSFFEKIFGTYSYEFEIGVKPDNWSYEFDYTHLFLIDKKKQILEGPKGVKRQLDSRLLILIDIAYDGNENPEAFWDCYDQ
jgi:hypothetical protein